MKRMKSKLFIGVLAPLITTLVVWVGPAQPQEAAYPTKPIEIIVAFAPGGSTDLLNRTLASALSKKWGVPVNVVNKPGGNSVPGLLAGYNANPDGYTMMADANSTSSFLGVAVKDLPFKVMDRTFVARVGSVPHVLFVAANAPFKSLKDVAADAKRDPGNFTWAVNGTGTDSQGIANRQFFKEIDIDPRKTKAISAAGGAQCVVMTAGGHVKLGCTTLSSAVASLKAGTVRGLAITSKNRDPDWPDIPTTAELGYPNVNVVWAGGISGPPKLPAFIVAKWEKALEEILRDPEVIAKARSFGITPSYLNSHEAREIVIKETAEVNKLWEWMQ